MFSSLTHEAPQLFPPHPPFVVCDREIFYFPPPLLQTGPELDEWLSPFWVGV